MKCTHCGATARKGDGRFCSHCGGKLPDVPRITPDEWITHSERFDAAESSPRMTKAQAAPPPRVSVATIVAPLVFLVFWLAIGSFILSGAADAPGGFVLFAGGILAAGTIGVLFVVSKAIKFSRSPVERLLMVVLDERIAVSGGGENSSATTHYYATLSDRDGNRSEKETTGDVAGAIVRGDIGLALLRMNKLVAFHRLED